MTGITDLNTLIATMEPALAPQRYVFASVPHPSAKMLETAKGMFVEKEGVTLILQDDVAQALEIQDAFKPVAFIEYFYAACMYLWYPRCHAVHSALPAIKIFGFIEDKSESLES